MTVLDLPEGEIDQIIRGEKLGDSAVLRFRDTGCFRAGEIHEYSDQWRQIASDSPSPQQAPILEWIEDKVSIFEYFNLFQAILKGSSTVLNAPPPPGTFQVQFVM